MKYIINTRIHPSIILTYNCPPSAGEIYFFKPVDYDSIEDDLKNSDFKEAKEIIDRISKHE